MAKTQHIPAKLWRMAFLTSPLIGILAFAPIVLFVQTLPPEMIVTITPKFVLLLRAIAIVSSGIFVQWLINIGIWNWSQHADNQWLNRPFVRYLLSYILLLILLFLAQKYGNQPRPIDVGVFRWYPLVGIFASNSFILVLMNLMITQHEKATLQLENAALEISQLTTQQAQLKQQIHPHFLFNAMGTLQILIQKNPAKASNYAQKLATFLRSSIDLAEQDVLPIAEEIHFFENYIQLQQMRFMGAIDYEIAIPNTIQQQGRLPVFALQMLAENAIKHNAFSAKMPLKLSINYQKDGDWLVISNPKSPKFSSELSTGIGLAKSNETLRAFHRTIASNSGHHNRFYSSFKNLGFMKIVIIEDEPLIAEALQEEIQKTAPDCTILAQLGSIRETLDWLQNNDAPDLYFSDIELADGLSFEIFKQIQNTTPIIFCTAYNHYALEAFQVYGIDYLLKPFASEDIAAALEKHSHLISQHSPQSIDYQLIINALQTPKTTQKNTILIHKGDKIIPLATSEIALAQLENGIVYVHTFTNKRHPLNYNMERMTSLLGADFYRINRQFLIHRKAIKHASQYFARKLLVQPIIKVNEPLIVSKANATDFLRWLEE